MMAAFGSMVAGAAIAGSKCAEIRVFRSTAALGATSILAKLCSNIMCHFHTVALRQALQGLVTGANMLFV